MSFPVSVKIVEVSPRDGLQNEPIFVPTKDKLTFIQYLTDAGLTHIEATSFVSHEKIPQLSDSQALLSKLKQNKKLHYCVLVPNLHGFYDALEAGVKEIAVFGSPSEQFSEKNIHCSVSESLVRFKDIVNEAKQHDIPVRGYLSCIAGCPYEGDISIKKIVNYAKNLYNIGCYEISLGDTIGIGTPLQIKKIIKAIANEVPIENLAVHFHDTYGQALANIYSALEEGLHIIDSSVSGLGGCPYAKGASGNVATEDVVYMLNGLNIKSGIDLKKLIKAGEYICGILKRQSSSRVALAMSE